jgi:hypothetical protein
MSTTQPVAARAREILKIQSLPAALLAAGDGLVDAQLDTPYREGGWTVRQVVHHLADSHMNAFLRMKLILTEEHPTLKPYDQDVWARTGDSRAAPIASSLVLLEGLHARWARLLEEIPGDAWSRTGFHPERGDVSLENLLQTYAAHGEKHVGQITGLRKARGW